MIEMEINNQIENNLGLAKKTPFAADSESYKGGLE